MANQSAKKADQRTKDFRQYHGLAIVGLAVLYALIKFLIFSATWQRMHTVLFAVSVVMQYACYSWIFSHLESGGRLDDKGGIVEKCRDVLYLSMIAMTLSLVSDYAWLLYSIFPLYLVWKVLTWIGSSVFGSKEEEPVEYQLSKTQQKKMKRAEKFGRG